ncbi:MAG: ferredoxin family protein [Coriobacteriia bacterium]|nr:ferredoxin family protein [Coriobacteriia bacterium]
MAAQIIVSETYCKGCGLCVEVCPQKIMKLDEDTLSAKGYHPAMCSDPDECTVCLSCATICPDVAITVVKTDVT